MTDPTDENEAKKRKTRKEGETEGAASGNRGIVFSVDATKLKDIMANWRQMNMGEAISAFVEFVAEGTLRASANLMVKFDSPTKAGFAIVSQALRFGQDVMGAMRTRSREATAVIRRKYGINIKVKKQGVTIVAPNPGIS